MLKDLLHFQGTVYLPEDLQDVRKEDVDTSFLVKTG